MNILIMRITPNKVNMNTYNLQEVGLAKALVRKGHSCDVAYYCGKEEERTETIYFDDNLKINIIWLQGIGIFRECYYPSLKKIVHKYDIIQVGGYVGFVSWWLNKNVPNKVINYQGPYYYRRNKRDIIKAKILDALLLPESHKKRMIVTTKSVLATEYIKNKGIRDVTTVGVGLDLDNIIRENKGWNQNEFSKKLTDMKKREATKYILYVGVLEERRNILFLLEVFHKILAQMPECRLVIVGKGNKKYVDDCFKKIKQLKLNDKIFYIESLEQKFLKSVYECSDAFLLPTKYEIFGMVLLEAMYFGVPVFTTYNGGSSTLINEKNGIVIDEFDSDKWADKVISVLKNKEVSERICHNANKTITEEYTWDALADKFLKVYEKRLSGRA